MIKLEIDIFRKNRKSLDKFKIRFRSQITRAQNKKGKEHRTLASYCPMIGHDPFMNFQDMAALYDKN